MMSSKHPVKLIEWLDSTISRLLVIFVIFQEADKYLHACDGIGMTQICMRTQGGKVSSDLFVGTNRYIMSGRNRSICPPPMRSPRGVRNFRNLRRGVNFIQTTEDFLYWSTWHSKYKQSPHAVSLNYRAPQGSFSSHFSAEERTTFYSMNRYGLKRSFSISKRSLSFVTYTLHQNVVIHQSYLFLAMHSTGSTFIQFQKDMDPLSETRVKF